MSETSMCLTAAYPLVASLIVSCKMELHQLLESTLAMVRWILFYEILHSLLISFPTAFALYPSVTVRTWWMGHQTCTVDVLFTSNPFHRMWLCLVPSRLLHFDKNFVHIQFITLQDMRLVNTLVKIVVDCNKHYHSCVPSKKEDTDTGPESDWMKMRRVHRIRDCKFAARTQEWLKDLHGMIWPLYTGCWTGEAGWACNSDGTDQYSISAAQRSS